jgi:DNA-binding NarL/FixJ family response regulator
MSNLQRNIDVRGIVDDPGIPRSKNNDGAICVVYSNHPLAFRTIANAIASNPECRNSVRPYSEFKSSHECVAEILILDLCSVPEWEEALRKWHRHDGRAIVLISPGTQSAIEEVWMLSLGIAGVITFVDDIAITLPAAIEAVKQDKLWASPGALEEYIRRTNILLRHLSSVEQILTAREQQIVDFLREGLSNKEIAQTLGISERTAKFHVSNLLKKCNADSRWAFMTPQEPPEVAQLRLVECGEGRKGQGDVPVKYRYRSKLHAEPNS